ncbi:MAG: TetR/AcrR family transcriptional regulator [Verrucomicrobiaceae bacterium]|nr:TetR/AcrR family transcriptional regulator [Verrucomicrobiaceae bacterium]
MSDPSPDSNTKDRILEAAEELYALHGFDAVSVRDVTHKAGVNVAAVSYHFGSREGLIQAVLDRSIAPVVAERLQLLDVVTAGDQPPTVTAVLDALIRPLVIQVRRSELSQALFVKLAGRCMSDGLSQMPAECKATIRSMVGRFVDALHRALPNVPKEILAWRLHFCHGALMETLARDDALQEFFPDRKHPLSTDELLAALLGFCSAGVSQ